MRSDGTAVSQPPSRVFGSLTSTSLAHRAFARPISVLRGRDAVLAMQPALVQLARRTGQAGSMDWIDHFIQSPDSIKKTPYLLLAFNPDRRSSILPQSRDVHVDDLQGAILLYEYRFAGLPTGIFATDDVHGTRTVIAPAESRLQIALLGVRRLMQRQAAVVFATVGEDIPQPPPMQPPAADLWFGLRTRSVPACLSLASTFDATLTNLGPRTRRNLRYYRRRAVAELGGSPCLARVSAAMSS